MTESATQRLPSKATLIAGVLVIGGFLLSGVSWWFLVLAGAGVFGPAILRELGILNDKDEFQRQADHRAGYHAFLITGVVAIVLMAFFRSGERTVEHTERLATFFLALLWFSWVLSSLLAFWGPMRATTRLLTVLGCVVLVFAVLTNVGSEWSGWAALLMHPLLAVPFFVLAWLAGRMPRLAGALLVVFSVAFLVFFGKFDDTGPGLITNMTTLIWFISPPAACGVALLCVRHTDDTDESE